MRYHAHALAANGVDVDLVGLEGTPMPRAIADDSRIDRPPDRPTRYSGAARG